MALTDKNILITPNIGASEDPKIVFSGANSSVSAQNITLKAYPTSNGTLSFEGSAGQLFSITNSLSGTIYSVNDVSGIPSIEVLDTGLVKLAQYSGNVLVGTGTDNGTDKLQVNGPISGTALKGSTLTSSVATGTAPLTVSSTTLVNNLNADLWDGYQFSTYLNQPLRTDSGPTFGEIYANGWFRNNTSGLGLYNAATTQHFYSDDDNYWNIAGGTDANGLRFRDEHAGTIRGYVYADNSNNIGFLDNASAWKLRVVGADYTLVEGSSARAPIFYDSNDTGYYIDPASTSNAALRMRGGAQFGPNTTWGAYLYVGTDGRAGTSSTVAVTNGNLHIDSQNGSQLYLNWYSTENIYTQANIGVGSSSASYRLHVFGTGYATSDFRAPIFYDSDNTGYYVDPASTSVLNGLTVGGGTAIHSSNFSSYVFGYRGGLPTNGWDAAGTGHWQVTNQTGETGGPSGMYSYGGLISIRASDYGNSHRLQIYATHTGEMAFRTGWGDWSYGWRTILHSSNYTSYAPSLTGAGASGTWSINVTGSAGSAPANGGTSSYVTVNYNNDSNSTYQMLWGSGNGVYGTGGIYCNPSSDLLYAAAFYDANNTGYYVDPNGTSTVSYVVISKTTGVTVGTAGGSDQFQIQNAGTGGSIMSFHRTGAYAINLGLDTDNVFRLGGWSNGTNVYRWQSDTLGNFTAQSNVTAYSDERLKKNWRALPDDIIKSLAQVKHGIYDRTDSEITQVGVSAQSLQAVMPEAVVEGADGMLSIAYGNAALAVVVEMAKRLCEQEARIAELEALINKITQ